jgi:hypothetical protein
MKLKMKKHRSVALSIVGGAALLAVGFLVAGSIPELVRYLRIRRM